MKQKKMKLTDRLQELGICKTEKEAVAFIMAGEIYVNGKPAKGGMMVKEEDAVNRKGVLPYASKGGFKMSGALDDFGIDVKGKICIDAGACTGGFTDCLLQQGASKVFAIDVGYGQLDWKIRSDPRVVVMERTNVRYVTPEQLGEPLDLSVIDVSFISLKIVLPTIKTLLKPTGQVLCLIKPQFEAGKDKVGKKGVVREPETHKEVLDSFVALANELNFKILGLTFSPVKGPEGNIEFLAHLTLADVPGIQPDTAQVVAQAHETLKV